MRLVSAAAYVGILRWLGALLGATLFLFIIVAFGAP
jgi:hypothetical protein